MALIDNLVAYWKLDEASGNAIDAHGSNTLTDTNSVGTGTGVINSARDFESGSTQYCTIADNTDLSTGNIDFTFSFWINIESNNNYRNVLGKGSAWSQAGVEYHVWLNQDAGQRVVWEVGTDGFASLVNVTANNAGNLSTGTWYFVVVWHDSVANEIGISVNDGTPDTTAHSAGVWDSDKAFSIGNMGSTGGGQTWDGLIDEVGFWKRVLTSGERTQLYNGGAGLAYPFASGAVICHLVAGGSLLW